MQHSLLTVRAIPTRIWAKALFYSKHIHAILYKSRSLFRDHFASQHTIALHLTNQEVQAAHWHTIRMWKKIIQTIFPVGYFILRKSLIYFMSSHTEDFPGGLLGIAVQELESYSFPTVIMANRRAIGWGGCLNILFRVIPGRNKTMNRSSGELVSSSGACLPHRVIYHCNNGNKSLGVMHSEAGIG